MTDDDVAPVSPAYRISETDSHAIMDGLLLATQASRASLRLIDGVGGLLLRAEALADGQPAMMTGPGVDPRQYETYQYLARYMQALVQPDCREGPPHPPPMMIEHYGVLAQILSPVSIDGELVGAISLHQAGRTRDWSDQDLSAVAMARRRVEVQLTQNPKDSYHQY
jgi:GAF domain-containing protein